MWAAAVALIDDYRVTLDKPSLGFLNQRLYTGQAARAAIIDITKGSSPSCRFAGFNATVGWDSVTGLGGLDFGKLNVALST